MTTSSTLFRPYIGSRRNRSYIHNKVSSRSLLSNDSFLSPTPSSKSYSPAASSQPRSYLSKLVTDDVPFPAKEKSFSIDHAEHKAKDCLSSSVSFPITSTIRAIHRSFPFVVEQENIEQSTRNQSVEHFLDVSSLDGSNSIEDNNYIHESSVRLKDAAARNNHNHQLTSTPVLPTVDEELFAPLRIVEPRPARHSQSSTMASGRSSSGFGTTSNVSAHTYDQRVSDQGTKYTIQLRTDEYDENEFLLTPLSSLHQLIIDAKHQDEDHLGGYTRRELHKVFPIPKHIDLNQHTYSYDKHARELTIEMPYRQSPLPEVTSQPLTFSYGNLYRTTLENVLPTAPTFPSNGLETTPVKNEPRPTKPFDFDLFHRSVFRPQIVQTSSADNRQEKKLLMTLDLSDYQPEDIKVSIKDQELIVKAERQIATDSRKSRTSFFQSTSLPPQTDIDQLRSNYLDGKLIIEAPYLERRVKTLDQHGAQWQTAAEARQRLLLKDEPFLRRTVTMKEFSRRL